MNKQQYQDFLKSCQSLQYKVHDRMDDKNSSIGRALIAETKNLIEEIEMQKNPKTLEEKVKHIQSLFHKAKEEGDAIMDYTDISFFDESYEHLKLTLRKFDNY